jgi:hypothetical protein
MAVVAAPSSSAIRSPQPAQSAAVPPGGTAAEIRNAPSSFDFAQQMVRSDLPPPQNAPMDRVNNIESRSSEILASFQIQRTGQQVRIVDADGSDYEGQVLEPALLQRMQTAAQANRPAAKAMAAPPGAANAVQQRIVGGNFQGQRNGYLDAQASAGELPPRTAIDNEAAQNQVSSPGAAGAQLSGQQQTGAGSGFAFQVSGLNRRLNQNVTILGNCSTAPLPISGFVTAGNLSNQSQARAGSSGVMDNLQVAPARPPASQSQNNFDNNNLNYRSNQNIQNAAFTGQSWRVTGQVQIGPSNYFDLDAATVPP